MHDEFSVMGTEPRLATGLNLVSVFRGVSVVAVGTQQKASDTSPESRSQTSVSTISHPGRLIEADR